MARLDLCPLANMNDHGAVVPHCLERRSQTRCTTQYSRQLPSFFQSPFDFDGAGRGPQAKWGAPDPGPRSSGDQGTYLACLPARNIRPSHSPSTWARPAPLWRPGFVLTHRTSHGRPIRPARPAYTTHAHSKKYLGAFASCAVRERQVARPVSRRRAAQPTGPPIARNCGEQPHRHSSVSEH